MRCRFYKFVLPRKLCFGDIWVQDKKLKEISLYLFCFSGSNNLVICPCDPSVPSQIWWIMFPWIRSGAYADLLVQPISASRSYVIVSCLDGDGFHFELYSPWQLHLEYITYITNIQNSLFCVAVVMHIGFNVLHASSILCKSYVNGYNSYGLTVTWPHETCPTATEILWNTQLWQWLMIEKLYDGAHVQQIFSVRRQSDMLLCDMPWSILLGPLFTKRTDVLRQDLVNSRDLIL